MVHPPASVKVSDLFRVSLWGQVADKTWTGHEHLLMGTFRYNHEGSREVAIVKLHPAIAFVQKAWFKKFNLKISRRKMKKIMKVENNKDFRFNFKDERRFI